MDAATVIAEADRALAELDHRAAELFGEVLAKTAADLAHCGWTVHASIGMTGADTARARH